MIVKIGGQVLSAAGPILDEINQIADGFIQGEVNLILKPLIHLGYDCIHALWKLLLTFGPDAGICLAMATCLGAIMGSKRMAERTIHLTLGAIVLEVIQQLGGVDLI